jgi:hypothetical protein
MWRDILQKLSEDLTFNPPASAEEIARIAGELGTGLPDELRSILSESNGIEGKYGLGLLWDGARILQDNRLFRSSPDFPDLYMPFDHLLFFGDAGNGDQFAFSILRGGVTRSDIFVWNHEDDSRSWIAPSLETFYEWWLTGKISV